MFKHGQAPESPLLLYYRDFYNKYHMVKKKNYALRFTADEPIQEVYAGHGDFISAPLVSDGEDLCIMVWNIYKQQRDDWLSVLKSYSAQSHLMLLQEAQSTPELVDFATSHYVVADQVPAINFPLKSYHSSGDTCEYSSDVLLSIAATGTLIAIIEVGAYYRLSSRRRSISDGH